MRSSRNTGSIAGKLRAGKPLHELEDFMHVERMRELVRRLVPPVPVVEVAGDDERGIARARALDALAQALELAAASACRECQMHAHAMQRHVPAGNARLRNEAARAVRSGARRRPGCPRPVWESARGWRCRGGRGRRRRYARMRNRPTPCRRGTRYCGSTGQSSPWRKAWRSALPCTSWRKTMSAPSMRKRSRSS